MGVLLHIYRSSMSYDEKANVSIDAEGSVLKCAKGADIAECGYVKGAKICAKCGAMPLEMKMVPVDSPEVKSIMTEQDMAEGVGENDEMLAPIHCLNSETTLVRWKSSDIIFMFPRVLYTRTKPLNTRIRL